MNRSVRFAIAGTAVAACASVGLATPVWAAGSASTSLGARALTEIKANAASAISLRLSALTTAISAVNNNVWLTSSDKSTLLNTLDGDQSNLTALAPKIQADTTIPQARTDAQSIVLTYRVFALAIPQVRLSAATDDIIGGALVRLGDAKNPQHPGFQPASSPSLRLNTTPTTPSCPPLGRLSLRPGTTWAKPATTSRRS